MIIIIVAFGFMGTGCQDITVGYLLTEDASYEIDSLVIKSVLDTRPPVEVPNPEFQRYLDYGWDAESIISMLGVFPTIKEGGGVDYDRDFYGIPWTSTPIEGVQGTEPIFASIKTVTSDVGDVGKILEFLTVRGDGTLSIPTRHEIPVGRYKISLTFENEGYSKDVDDCFTIIVK